MAHGFAGSGDGQDDDQEDRARAEATLCAHFRQQKYQGPDWDKFVHELLAYGIDRVRMLILSGIIVQDDNEVGRPRYGPAFHRQAGDLEELVQDVVLAGFTLFVAKGLIGRGWSPTAGASLTTYFIGACKLTFKETHRSWCRRHKHRNVEELKENLDALLPGWWEPDEHVEQVLDRLTEVLSDEELQLFVWISEGHSQADIAKKLGISERAVEGRIYRARAKARPLLPPGWGEI